MRKITIIFALFVSCLMVSCQEETVKITPNNTKHSGAKLLEADADPSYYNINYNDHGSILVSQYKKRARLNSIPAGQYNGLTIYEVVNRSIYGTSIQRDIAGTVIADLNSTSYLPKTVTFIGKQCVVFRGGNTFSYSSNQVKFTSTGSGIIKGNTSGGARGLSLECNYNLPYILGNGYKIKSLPSGLTIILAGDRGPTEGHSEIVPINDMPEATYISKLSQIQTDAAQ